jgi:hypothetical protein
MKLLLAITLLFATTLSFGQYNQNLSPTEEKKNIAVLVKKQALAKGMFAKKPKDPKIRKAYVESNVALGLQYTYAQTVDRKLKYKLALTYLREALKLEPNHKDAKPMYDQIVSIYKSMGRPVPGGG